jgi:two-component system, OmpR family, KDP operon response regulator KdpE
VQGKPIHVTPKEFDLLIHLANHPGKIITHRMLIAAAWGDDSAHRPEHLRVPEGLDENDL